MTKEQLMEMIKEVVAAQITQMREDGAGYEGIVKTASPGDLRSTLQEMGINYAMNNECMVLDAGSVISLKNKNAPWIRLGEQMKEFAEGMREFIKSKGVVSKFLQENSDPAGGYLVPEEFQATLIQYDTEPAVIWPRATIWPMNTDKLGMPKLKQRPDEDAADWDHFAGVSFSWTDEGGQKSETEPEFEFIELIAHELSGYTAVTNTLLEDSAINLMNFLTGLFRRAYIWMTDRSFIRGTGARQPLGIVTDPAVLTVNRTTSGVVTFADLLAMDSKLPSVFDANAIWITSKKVLNSIRGQVDTNGQPILQEFYSGAASYGAAASTYMLGYPVVKADGKVYGQGVKGDIILCDPSWYYVGDRKRFTFDMSTHYLFRNNKTALRVCGRLDGQCAFPEAFVVLDLTTGGS